MAAKKVTIMCGFIPIRTKIEVAVDEESSGLYTVCTGHTDGEHDPARVKASVACPTCERTHSSVFGFGQRGYEDGDKVVVVDAAALAAAQGEPRTGRVGKDPIDIAFHSREKVFAATVAGDSVQNVYPDKGGEKAYELLRDTLSRRPDLVAVMIWAPTTKNALWTLEVVGERIVATKRAWPEAVRATVNIPTPDLADAERAMFDQFVDASVEDFDLGRYVDQSKLGRDELLAQARSGALPAALPQPAAAPAISDLLSNLQASLDAVTAKQAPPRKRVAKKAPAKKTTTPRKAVAKKAPAKRTTTKKEVAA